MVAEEIRDDVDNFPSGMRVLAVDDDRTCLMVLETLLKKCQYNVTTTSQARIALKMLRDNKDRFDLVISDVQMPDMDGFKLLEQVGLEMDLPVIMLSGDSDPKLVMKGVTHGACDYLVKPVRMEELKNIWQHVLRKKKCESKQNRSSDEVRAHQVSGGGQGSPLAGNTDQKGKVNRKIKDEDYESEDNGNESDDNGSQKKPRVVWTLDLHRKFVNAVNQLGIEKAVPKRILDTMNAEGLTRENVASHLQKYRQFLKRISKVATQQQANIAAALGVKDSSFMHMGSLDGLRDFRSLARGRLSNVSLPPYTNGGMLGRLNSPGNVNLRNLTPSTLVQPSQAQNLSSSVNPLRKMHLVLPNSSHSPSLFQGIQSSLELDQLQQNKGAVGTTAHFNTMTNSRLVRTSSTFTDTGASLGISNNLLNNSTSNPLALHGNARQPLSDGGFVNQSAHDIASFTSNSFKTGVSGSSTFLNPGKCNDKWQNTVESSTMHSNPLLSSEPFHSQLPLNGSRDNYSSNGTYVQNNLIGLSPAMFLPSFEDSTESLGHIGSMGDVHHMNHVPGQSWAEQKQDYAHSSQIPVNAIMPNFGQSSGTLNQKMDMYIGGRSAGSASALMQQNEDGNLVRESRSRSNEDFLFEQPKLPGGFAPQSYDPLTEMMNAMIKREHGDTASNGNFECDDYSFGPGI